MQGLGAASSIAQFRRQCGVWAPLPELVPLLTLVGNKGIYSLYNPYISFPHSLLSNPSVSFIKSVGGSVGYAGASTALNITWVGAVGAVPGIDGI